MRLIKALTVAFSLYSAIPMPQFEWKEEDMRYSGCFFPLVGAVIGLLIWGWWIVGSKLNIPDLALVLVAVAIPLIITGGFHVDGYMDVCDAVKSYGDYARRLAILKDPHIGAFSVICLAKAGLLYTASIACITKSQSGKMIIELGITYVISRILSMITMKTLKLAKSDGMLSDEAGFSNNKMLIAVWIELILVAAAALYVDLICGLIILITSGLVTVYYRAFSYKKFGGITGDTAGYYVVINECIMAAALAVTGLII